MFYNEYFKCNSIEEATRAKEQYLNGIIENKTIFKFIQFGNEDLDRIKIETLDKEELWFCYYKNLNDPTEFEISYKIKKIVSRTGRTNDNIRKLIETIQQLYDVCSFTYEIDDLMWKEYGGNGNGICLKFQAQDYDYLYPIEYVEKQEINWTKLIIDSINRKQEYGTLYNEPMSVLPWVLKNPMNGVLDSRKEKEIRILHCPYDHDFNDGLIYPQVKSKLKYIGENVKYKDKKLKLEEIIIGQNCESVLRKQIIEIASKQEIPVSFSAV